MKEFVIAPIVIIGRSVRAISSRLTQRLIYMKSLEVCGVYRMLGIRNGRALVGYPVPCGMTDVAGRVT